jgi:hypothetical protein
MALFRDILMSRTHLDVSSMPPAEVTRVLFMYHCSLSAVRIGSSFWLPASVELRLSFLQVARGAGDALGRFAQRGLEERSVVEQLELEGPVEADDIARFPGLRVLRASQPLFDYSAHEQLRMLCVDPDGRSMGTLVAGEVEQGLEATAEACTHLEVVALGMALLKACIGAGVDLRKLFCSPALTHLIVMTGVGEESGEGEGDVMEVATLMELAPSSVVVAATEVWGFGWNSL